MGTVRDRVDELKRVGNDVKDKVEEAKAELEELKNKIGYVKGVKALGKYGYGTWKADEAGEKFSELKNNNKTKGFVGHKFQNVRIHARIQEVPRPPY